MVSTGLPGGHARRRPSGRPSRSCVTCVTRRSKTSAPASAWFWTAAKASRRSIQSDGRRSEDIWTTTDRERWRPFASGAPPVSRCSGESRRRASRRWSSIAEAAACRVWTFSPRGSSTIACTWPSSPRHWRASGLRAGRRSTRNTPARSPTPTPDRPSKHRERIRRRPGAPDHPQGRDHQHELVALLLEASARERLEERIVEQRHTVGEDRGVDGPRDVVADRQVGEHVPDEHAHVVVAQERQAGHVQSRPLLLRRVDRAAVRSLRILRLPCLTPGVDADRVAGLELDPALGEDVVELPAVDGSIVRDTGYAAVPRNIEHDSAGHDALGPVLDGSEPRALEGDLFLRVAPVPHRVVVPGVAQGVEVGGGDAVIVDPVIVGREAALAARVSPHEMMSRERIVRPRLLRERPAERDTAPGTHQPGRRRPLGGCDEVDRAELVVLAPATPVAALPDPAEHFLLRR